jgi:hypothetical protein
MLFLHLTMSCLILIVTRYYEGGVSSVYLWDLEDGGFAGVVLLKKSTHSPACLLFIDSYLLNQKQ